MAYRYKMFVFILTLSAVIGLLNATNTTSPSPSIKPTNKTVNIEKQFLTCENFKIYAISNTLNIPYTVTCCLSILFAFYFIIVGYRCFKISLFLMGFIFATLITFIILNGHVSLPLWGLIAISLAVGLFCGLLTTFVIYCGLFLGGFSFGFFIGILIFFIVEYFIHVNIKWIPFGVLLGLSLFFGVLSLKFQKAIYILSTSALGGALVAGGIDYFVEGFTLLYYTWNKIVAEDGRITCWITYVILAIWPFLFIIGCIVQFAKTGRKFDHTEGKDSVTLQGEDKAMQRYRSLNMNGDVVAKSYYHGEDPGRATTV